LLIVLVLGFIACLIIGDYAYWRGRYPPNCFFENIDVSLLNRSETIEKLSKVNVDQAVNGYIKLYLDGKVYRFLPSEINVSINPRKSVDRTAKESYRNNFIRELLENMLFRLSKKEDATVMPLALQVNKATYKNFLDVVAKRTDVASKDAGIEILSNNDYRIIDGIVGKRVEVQASIKRMERALDKNMRSITIEVTIFPLRVYAKDLKPAPPRHLLANFTTHFGTHNSANRVHNIKHVASLIDNYILLSGESYSLINRLGEITQSTGFKRAFIIRNDTLDPQYGGGTCQVSTTLYNAVMLAGLDVTERHNHALYFNIYPLGRDAAVYSKTKDLRFINNTGNPILIRASATASSATVKIYGTPISGKKLYFTSPTVYIDGKRPDTDTPQLTMERIREILDKYKKKPFVSSVRLITYQDNMVIRQKEIRSYYKFAAYPDNVDIVEPEPVD